MTDSMTEGRKAMTDHTRKERISMAREICSHRGENPGSDREILEKLIRAATLLQQNSVACAKLHHGLDIKLNGLPGWLRDTEKAIERARALCSLPSTEQVCAKCGCETRGEEALVSGEIWCHPCADNADAPSTEREGK